ncbi:hypothetical protein APY03_0725 [Variovorax sp. WDL1]|nr:hypothetical protein APY03_0725 [Variovorax sp. WDL1]
MAIGTFVGCIIALPSLSRGLLYQPTMRLIAPVMLVFVVGSHIDGVGAAPTLELGLLPALSTLLVCGLLWLIAEYRHHQDMERLRD